MLEDELISVVDELVDAEGVGHTPNDKPQQILIDGDFLNADFTGLDDLFLCVLGPIVLINADSTPNRKYQCLLEDLNTADPQSTENLLN